MATTAPPYPTSTNNGRSRVGRTVIAIFVAMLFLVAGFLGLRGCSRGDVPPNTEIPISVMLRHPVQLDGDAVPGRLFEFVDRNGPLGPSVIIPLKNKAGVELVRLDSGMSPGTIKFVDIHMPARVVDAVRYPEGTIRVVYYNVHHIEPQAIDPTPAIPRRE